MKSFYFDIEPYEILVSGISLMVLPMVDGTYRVYIDLVLLADLYPEITSEGILWNAFDLIAPLFAAEIGEEIYSWENRNQIKN